MNNSRISALSLEQNKKYTGICFQVQCLPFQLTAETHLEMVRIGASRTILFSKMMKPLE